MVHILYPERRMVSEQTVIDWAKDELVNALTQHRVFESDEEWDAAIAGVYNSTEYRNMTLESAKEILNDSGEITFAR